MLCRLVWKGVAIIRRAFEGAPTITSEAAWWRRAAAQSGDWHRRPDRARRLYWLCGNPDYNIILRSLPLKHDKQLAASYHWHLEVSPRFTKAGGLELATQNSFSVLLTDPADAARKLRAAVMPEGGKRRGSCLAYVE